jgi:hypothetical protein
MRAAESTTSVLPNDEAVHLSESFTTRCSDWKRFPESRFSLRQMLKTCVNSGKDLQRGRVALERSSPQAQEILNESA